MNFVVAHISNYPPVVLKGEIEKPMYKDEPLLHRLRRTVSRNYPFLTQAEITGTKFENIKLVR
jgi:hypothetical protein